jgi:TatD DNase family protein
MIETDAPYLMPRNISPKPKSRRNEPRNLTYVCETVAECLDLSYEEVAAMTTDNARRFFDLPELPA